MKIKATTLSNIDEFKEYLKDTKLIYEYEIELDSRLPVNPKQRFQIGDICRIVRADNTVCYPPKKDEDTEGYDCLVVIMCSYAQNFPHINPHDTCDYHVYLPQWLNPDKYDEKGWYHGKTIKYGAEFSWSWVSDYQLEFVRKPTKEEVDKIIAFGEKTNWKEYKKNRPETWIWDSYQDLLENSQKMIENGSDYISISGSSIV